MNPKQAHIEIHGKTSTKPKQIQKEDAMLEVDISGAEQGFISGHIEVAGTITNSSSESS